MKQSNLDFVDKKFRELGITLPKQELEFATKQIVLHGQAIGLKKSKSSDDTLARLVDTDTKEINEDIWNIIFNTNERVKIKDFESLGWGSNIKDFIMTRQNHLIQNQGEEEYSIGRSNDVSRYLRALNECVLKTPRLQENTYFTKQIIQAIVKKIFKIELEQPDLTRAVKDRNFLRYFFNSETYLTSSKLFWIVFDVVYTFSNFNEINYSDWERVLSRYDRISKDEYFVERCKKINGDIVAKHSRDFFNGTNLNDYITIYRGFLVKPNRYVRKGIKKLNNPNAHIQDEGKGFSYTLDKEQAVRFASRYHFKTDLNYRKNLPTIFGSLSSRKSVKKLQREYKKVLGYHYNTNYLNEDVRRCYGTYRVKKKHIITFDVLGAESEVFVDPNNVELIRYDFINDEQDINSAIWNAEKEPIVYEQGQKCMYDLVKNNDYHFNLETLFEELNLEQIKEFYLPTSLQNKLIERSAV